MGTLYLRHSAQRWLFPAGRSCPVSGDGCFLMTGQELATAVQHGINIVAIVINDRCLTGIAACRTRITAGVA